MEKPSSTGIWYICKYDPVLNGMYWIPKVKQASLLANANSKWVSAELGYGGDLYGMLRGRADLADGWEEFDLTNFSDGTWGIYSLANGLFSSAELGYTGDFYGMLRARATDPNGWERYYLYDLDSGGPYVFQSVGNGNYVSTEIGYGGGYYAMLRARASAIGDWEKYWIGFPTPSIALASHSASSLLASSIQAKTVRSINAKTVPAWCPMASGKTVSCRRLTTITA